MDIAGAKALKERLGFKGDGDSPPARELVPENQPPLFHWFGIRRAPSDTSPTDGDEEATDLTTSFLRWLGLSFR